MLIQIQCVPKMLCITTRCDDNRLVLLMYVFFTGSSGAHPHTYVCCGVNSFWKSEGGMWAMRSSDEKSYSWKKCQPDFLLSRLYSNLTQNLIRDSIIIFRLYSLILKTWNIIFQFLPKFNCNPKAIHSLKTIEKCFHRSLGLWFYVRSPGIFVYVKEYGKFHSVAEVACLKYAAPHFKSYSCVTY